MFLNLSLEINLLLLIAEAMLLISKNSRSSFKLLLTFRVDHQNIFSNLNCKNVL